jgi:hypothetical protein
VSAATTGGPGRGLRIVLGAALVAASVAAMGIVTRAGPHPGDADAELRLAWRTPVPRVVECRTLTAEELAELPVHMRQAEICEPERVAYRLEVRVDGELRRAATVAASGARGDRPIYVFETLPLEAGARRLRVVFERADGRGSGDSAVDETGAPYRLVLDRRLDVGVRDVVLVTYDRGDGTLVLRHRSRE